MKWLVPLEFLIMSKNFPENIFLAFACITLIFLLASCVPADLSPRTPVPEVIPTTSPLGPGEIVVAAAADLNFAFKDIAQLFEQQTDHRVVLVFGSTGHLTQQIENGAPFDLIASANEHYIVRLAEQGLVVEDTIQLYAQGFIVLAANRDSGVRANVLEDLLSDQIQNIAIANPDHAPYGLAARQALESANLWEPLQHKLVLAENVRQALQYVQSGDAEAGLLALSIASVPEITWLMVDAELYEPLYQALAVTTSSKRPDIARQFAAFVVSETGRQILYSYGFRFPGETEPPPTPQP
jgi:molybdate transport system substrate-binding protein